MSNKNIIPLEDIENFVQRDWSSPTLREDLQLAKIIAEGMIDNLGSELVRRTLNDSASFTMTGSNGEEIRVWFGLRMGDYIGWQIADLIDGKFKNQRGWSPDLEDTINDLLKTHYNIELPVSLGKNFYEDYIAVKAGKIAPNKIVEKPLPSRDELHDSILNALNPSLSHYQSELFETINSKFFDLYDTFDPSGAEDEKIINDKLNSIRDTLKNIRSYAPTYVKLDKSEEEIEAAVKSGKAAYEIITEVIDQFNRIYYRAKLKAKAPKGPKFI